jgi:hypothetical protein
MMSPLLGRIWRTLLGILSVMQAMKPDERMLFLMRVM